MGLCFYNYPSMGEGIEKGSISFCLERVVRKGFKEEAILVLSLKG